MPEEKKLTHVEKKSLALIEDTLANISDFDDIRDVIEYLQNGITSLNALLSLGFMIKEGTELTEKFKKQMKNTDAGYEIFTTAMNDLAVLVKKFMVEKN